MCLLFKTSYIQVKYENIVNRQCRYGKKTAWRTV